MPGKALPGFAGYLQRKAAMHPSVTFGDTSPCRGGFIKSLPPGRLPCKGSWRRQPTEGCGALPCQYPSGLAPPGGRSRPPYIARQMGGITGDGRRCPGVGRLSAPTGRSAPCVGADDFIGPLAGLANGCCFLCYCPLAGLCRAGDLARRMGFAISQGLRDDACIVPYGCGAGFCRSLQEAALKGKPSPLPLRAAFCAAALFAGRQLCQGVSGKARHF